MKQEHDIYNDRLADTKAYRQTTLMLDRDVGNNQAITFGQIRELEAGVFSDSGPVKNYVKIPKSISIIGKIGACILIVGFVFFAILEVMAFTGLSRQYRTIDSSAIYAVILMVVGIVMYGGSHAYGAYQERKRWLNVVRQQDEEKKKQG